jgi:site-specific DNA-methyltransferase (adenine-specific)
MDLRNGDCLDLMKTLPDKSVDIFICDLPYGETNCKWDTQIDLEEFWNEFYRLRKSKKSVCMHFCSTKFGYNLIKSNEKLFKMDLVWKKRNKTGGLQSRYRPMRNHEMIYFFYEQAPKYNRDKYHKRIKAVPKFNKDEETISGMNKKENTHGTNSFEPTQPTSVLEETDIYGETRLEGKIRRNKPGQAAYGANTFEPPNPGSVVEEEKERKSIKNRVGMCEKTDLYPKENQTTSKFEPPNPSSVIEEEFDYIENADEAPYSIFESKKVFIGKRNHQTEKPQDILEFFLKYWTDENDTVLDPTMGSGSTGVACKKMKRKFIGFELDQKIFEKAKNRINKS